MPAQFPRNTPTQGNIELKSELINLQISVERDQASFDIGRDVTIRLINNDRLFVNGARYSDSAGNRGANIVLNPPELAKQASNGVTVERALRALLEIYG